MILDLLAKGIILMDFNKAFYQRKEDRDPQWILVDAKGKVLGRLATWIADTLRGKNKPIFAPTSQTTAPGFTNSIAKSNNS